MEYLSIIFFGLLIINLVMVTFRLFESDQLRISFSIWMKILPIWSGVSSIIFMVYLLFSAGISIGGLVSILFFISFFAYTIYATREFVITVWENDFYWFNGITIKSVDGNKIKQIYFHKPKFGNKVSKIEFILSSENITFRNDLGVEWMIKYLAKENNIKIDVKRSTDDLINLQDILKKFIDRWK